MKKRQLSPEKQEAARRLLLIWNAKRKTLGLTQAKVAEEFGFTSHTAIYQYLHGLVPLGTDALIKFSRLLNVDPEDIQPNLAQRFDVLTPLLGRMGTDEVEISNEDWKVIQLLREFPQDKRVMARRMLEVMAAN